MCYDFPSLKVLRSVATKGVPPKTPVKWHTRCAVCEADNLLTFVGKLDKQMTAIMDGQEHFSVVLCLRCRDVILAESVKHHGDTRVENE
jgi:hypothetical protein